jgi:pyruvate ferredoxin oxidoreductase alpha subunit
MVDDADVIFLVLGSTAGTLRSMVRRWREEGKKVGVISLTLYRPFPDEELVAAVSNAETVVIMDRSYSFGSPGGQLYMDAAAAFQKHNLDKRLVNVIYGLGGRDFTPEMANEVLRAIEDRSVNEYWVGVR